MSDTFFCQGCQMVRRNDMNTTRKGKRTTCVVCTSRMIERSKLTGTTDTRTKLGKRLMMIRNAAIANGVKALSKDEVLEEVANRRSGRGQ